MSDRPAPKKYSVKKTSEEKFNPETTELVSVLLTEHGKLSKKGIKYILAKSYPYVFRNFAQLNATPNDKARTRRYVNRYGMELIDTHTFKSDETIQTFLDVYLPLLLNKIRDRLVTSESNDQAMPQAGPSVPPTAPALAPTPVPITGIRRAASNSPQNSSGSEGKAKPSRVDDQLAALMGRTGLAESVPQRVAQARQYIKKRTKASNPEEQMTVDRRMAATQRQEAAKAAAERKAELEKQAKERQTAMHSQKQQSRKEAPQRRAAADALSDLVEHFVL